MKRYAEYKDSGVEWIGEIPEEWEACKLKYVFKDGENGIKIGPFGSALKGKTLSEGTYKIYNQAHLIQNDFSIDRHFVSEDTYNELLSYVVQPGDILFSMMGTIGKCRIMPSGFPLGIMDSHLLKAKLNDQCLPEYFQYVYDKDNSNVIIEQLLYYSNGSIMNGLNSSIIKNVYLALPNKTNQQVIVDYLDRKTSAIDFLIADKHKLIDLLKEKRQSIISEAVTKGLDKNTKMKDSGIEWIGEMPEGWEVKQMQHIISDEPYSMVDGPFGSDMKNEEYVDDGVPIIQLNNIGIGEHKLDKLNYITEEKAVQLSRHRAFANEIVMAKMAEPVARATIISQEFDMYVLSADCIKVKLSYLANKKLVVYALNSYIRKEAELLSTGTTRIRINLSIARKLHILIPPLSVQERIANYLDQKTSAIDSLITDITTQIEKLKEYRQSIISEAVTGKVAV